MKNKFIILYLTVIGLLLASTIGWYSYSFLSQPTSDPCSTDSSFTVTRVAPTAAHVQFDGQHAYTDVHTQVAFGARIPGSEGHAKVQAWICSELKLAGWQVEVQQSKVLGHPVQNIVAKRETTAPQIILGAHYDTRMYADQDADPLKHTQYVPGANDGASGVAVLLELARILPKDSVPVWLVFFDAEDNGNIQGWDWLLGSREFVKNNPVQPQAAIVIDMIGDADLNIYKEKNSNPALTDEIWIVASGLGYGNVFVPRYKYSMLDDHTPFLQAGIPAVDIIDFDYPYWHTTQDTPDKVSAESLQAVGETLDTWVMQQSEQP